MHLVSLAVSDFRNIEAATIEPDPEGTTVITGPNGSGKTNLLEATAYLSSLQSFRGSPKEAMVRRGATEAILRAQTVVEGRSMTIEAELSATGRSRTLVNRQAVRRRDGLHPALRTTVFSPEDIGMVRFGPGERRRFLDETLSVVDPRAARTAGDVDRILRQRAALLRPAGRRLDPDSARTLDVWDMRLDEAGTALVEAREALVGELAPRAEAHYGRLAGAPSVVALDYHRSWEGRLIDALAAHRTRDLERECLPPRTPPRRVGDHSGGAAQPDPFVAGGAALSGPGPPPGRSRAGHRAFGLGPGPPPGRRFLRARPLPLPSPVGQSPARTDSADHRPPPPDGVTAAKVYTMAANGFPTPAPAGKPA